LAFVWSVLTFVLSVLTFVWSVLTFVLSVLTFVLSVLTFVWSVLTFVLSVLTFVWSVLAFVLSVLTFVLSVLTSVLSVLTSVLSVLTFVLSVLTSVLSVLTFVLPVLTSVLPVLAFVLSVLLQLTVSDYYHFGIFNIFLDLTVNICRKLPTTSKSMANFTIPGCIKHVSGLDYVIVVNNTAMHVNHYFNNNMAVSLIGGGNRSMQRKNYIPTASYEQT
jgi:hypothetical protein